MDYYWITQTYYPSLVPTIVVNEEQKHHAIPHRMRDCYHFQLENESNESPLENES